MTPTRDWDAVSYVRTAAPVESFGLKLLGRLDLHGDESILDAGCGTGGVTEQLLALVPKGRVIGVDGSPSMIERANARLGDRAELRVGDLLDLELAEPVDLVFSSATFHWIADHDRLFARLFAALKPGGCLLAQCGGAGNIAAVRAGVGNVAADAPYAAYLADWPSPWNFAGPEETVPRLERAGFVDVHAGLHDEPVDPDDPREFVATMILGSHLERLPSGLRESFLDRVLVELGEPLTIEYVRLTDHVGANPDETVRAVLMRYLHTGKAETCSVRLQFHKRPLWGP
jgi:trans-aconitate 2-methyltransferase